MTTPARLLLLAAFTTSGCVVAVPAATPQDNRTPLTTLPPAITAQPAAKAPVDRWGKADVPTRNNLLAVSAPSARVAFAVGEAGTLVKTVDGGETWTLVTSATAPTDTLTDVAFLDARAGWVLGEKALYITKDGGESWATHDLFGKYADFSAVSEVPQITLVDYERGAVHVKGHVFATTDGGATWAEIAAAKPVQGGFNDNLQSGKRLVAIGDGYALLTPWGLFKVGSESTDGNREKVAGLADFEPVEVAFSDPKTGWVFGVAGSQPSLRRTTDGGLTWTASTPVVRTVGDTRLKLGLPTGANGAAKLILLGGDRAALMGRNPDTGSRILAETTDGTTWNVGPGFNFFVKDIAIPAADHGYAVGDSGTIWTITSK